MWWIRIVSAEMAALGFTVMHPIELLSDSVHFDLGNCKLLEWLCFMLQTGRIRSLMCEPPCTFSAAAHPAVRSYKPAAWIQQEVQEDLVRQSSCLSLASSYGWVARTYNRPNLLEQPFLSKMAWLSMWKLNFAKGFIETAIASCMFGSPQKSSDCCLMDLTGSSSVSLATDDISTYALRESSPNHQPFIVPRLAKRFCSCLCCSFGEGRKG